MERASDIVSRLPIAIARLDRDHVIVEANERLASSMGADLDEVIGRRCEAFDNGYFTDWGQAIDACFETGDEQRVSRTVSLNEEDWLVDYRFALDAAPDRVLAIAKTNERATALRKSLGDQERLLRLYLDHAPVFAWLRDIEEGEYRMVNETYLRHYGLEREEVIGQTVEERWPGPISDAFKNNDAEVVRTGEARRFYELAPDPDGTTHRFLNVKFPFESADRECLVGCVGIDVTDHERMERRMLRLEQAQDVAGLALGAAHDLANELTVLHEAATSLARSLEGSGRLDARWLVTAADRTLSHLRHLRDPSHSRDAIVDLRGFLAEAMESLAATTGLSISWHCPPRLQVAMPPEELHRVLVNLVRNSAEAMEEPGEGCVDISGEVAAHLPDRPVLLIIRDDGPGISPEVRDGLFDVLVSTKGPGRGLGLAGVRAVVRQRGGDITLCDVNGPGACFEILLPGA